MILKELFETGYSFDEEFENADLAHREKSSDYRKTMKISEEIIDTIKSIKEKIYILGFSELWCPDCQMNLTVMDYLTKINDNIKLSLHKRSGNEDIIKQYSDDKRVKIPLFIYLNEEFEIIGTFVELPSNVKAIENSENQVEKIVTKREYRKGSYMEQTIIDFITELSKSYNLNI